MAPQVFDEALGEWFEADCQDRRALGEPLCGHPAIAHRPNAMFVRHACACHATPAELERAAARAGQPIAPCPGGER
jgi:hypothetical protein